MLVLVGCRMYGDETMAKFASYHSWLSYGNASFLMHGLNSLIAVGYIHKSNWLFNEVCHRYFSNTYVDVS